MLAESLKSQGRSSTDIGNTRQPDDGGPSNKTVEAGDGGTNATTSNTVDFAFAKPLMPTAPGQLAVEVMDRIWPSQSQKTANEEEQPVDRNNDLVPKVHVTTPEASPLSPHIHPSSHDSHNSPNLTGNVTPPTRHSVQFVRSQTDLPHTRSDSWDGAADVPGKGGRGRLLSKLRAFAGSSTGHSSVRSPGENSTDERLPTGLFTPDRYAQEVRSIDTAEEGESDIDADGELSTGEDAEESLGNRRKRRKSRRPEEDGMQTAPVTPKTPIKSTYFRPHTPIHSIPRPSFLPRRATMTDLSADDRGGVSEDEGRDRITRGNAWKRGNTWIHSPRGLSYSGNRNDETPRPNPFRRFTGFGSSAENPDGSPSTPFGRATSMSAARWRQLKANIRLTMSRPKKPENTIDHAKSAELMAELSAGVPAALILASMFQRDEHGNRRIPILLEQLKVRLTDSKQVDFKSGDRHMVFRIELEYGNGLTRMKWVIHRSLRDFANLHARYKLQIGAQKYIQLKGDDARTKLPHFPKSAFPYLRGVRGVDSESEEEDADADLTGPSGGDASGTDRPKMKKRRKSSFLPEGGGSIGGVIAAAGSIAGAPANSKARKEIFAKQQRQKLEQYLQKMIRYLIFRPESNRLCKFLELSALGVRLAAEGSYHGKEGQLIIQSGRGIDFRRAWNPSLVLNRHSPKWFLVRHSYIVCVESPEEMNIYDVFLVDPFFQITVKKKRAPLRDQKARDFANRAKESAKHPQHHALKILNSERKLKLLAKNERQLYQFEESIQQMFNNTSWGKKNRFDSFAPIRSNVFAQWLVDGRDYMWNVSRAISMAKDVIYIHDWWLSPELYMRRPAAISQKWRLDRLLQRKAREGVKVFVIVYRNIESAIPIDSEYTKFSLLDLHPNVFVQRSPNQIRQNTFFWAHHEKICVVDHMIAFVGGIDLCFGRWDTPQHPVVDDKLTGFEEKDLPMDADHCQLWPGKDYSNPRVQDFYDLDKPYEEMYDRSRIPRMPWHDIAMQIVGQPARDLTRHFVQRWNFILRQRTPTRPTPFLLPPPDFKPAELEALGLNSTCEVQILRSCSTWSMGTPHLIECSILNAYVKMIEQSDHFVYIENQFYVSSCEVEGTRIENGIGDALVERIIRAAENNEDWRAILVIPLMPGFQNTVDSQDGTSVRLIMQCQYRSISRGEGSMFSRLRAKGIEPEDWIEFFSLRTWGKIGPLKQLVTEQLYIHAKCIVVDDRVALIGSANINERSMRGDRDSECAAIVRDTDMIWSTMNGVPYLVGRFPHTLRMRLMREHLGIDVDEVMEEERTSAAKHRDEKWEHEMDNFHGREEDDNIEAIPENDLSRTETGAQQAAIAKAESLRSFNHDVDWEEGNTPNIEVDKRVTQDLRVTGNPQHQADIDGEGPDRLKDFERAGKTSGRDTILVDGPTEVLVEPLKSDTQETRSNLSANTTPKATPSRNQDGNDTVALPPMPPLNRLSSSQLGMPLLSQLPSLPKSDDVDIGGPPIQRHFSQKASSLVNSAMADMRFPYVHKDCMRDPIEDTFYLDTWHTIAENNTRIFRMVFRCMPDNEVKTWKEYTEYTAYGERFVQAQGAGKSKDRTPHEMPEATGPVGHSVVSGILSQLGPSAEKGAGVDEAVRSIADGKVKESASDNRLNEKFEDWAEEKNKAQAERQSNEGKRNTLGEGSVNDEKVALRTSHESTKDRNSERVTKVPSSNLTTSGSPTKRRRRTTTRSSKKEFSAGDDMLSRADAEELLKNIQGNLVLWPYDWLAKEDETGNWLYTVDQLAPLEI